MQIISKHLWIIFAGIILVVVSIGLVVVYKITEGNKYRIISEWSNRLTVIADARADNVEAALDVKIQQLNDLVDQASLSLYLTTYISHQVDDVSIAAMRGHVQNLLRLSAMRMIVDNKAIFSTKKESGIAVVGLDNRILVSTEGLNVGISRYIKETEMAYASGEVQIINLFVGKNKALIYGLVAPVLKFQNIGSKSYVGAVVLFLSPQSDLFSLLKDTQYRAESFESLLVTRNARQLIYFNPLKVGAGIFKQVSNRPSLASAYAIRYPGTTKIQTDYNGEEVLVTARKINRSPWWLVQKVSIAEVLSIENKNQNYIIALFLMSVLSAFSAVFVIILLIRQHLSRLNLNKLSQQNNSFDGRNQGVINALVKAADAHDPYCANHSKKTRDVAIAIANEMGLDGPQLASLEVAAILANIGKLQVPKKILIKKQPLTEGESKKLKEHVEIAVDMLSDVEFEGPVLDIIAQKNECLDGSGYPKGLNRDEIIIESRILSVANSFVAMISARAYRNGLKTNDVLEELLAKSEIRYDKQVVTALIHVCENKTDLNAWLVI